MKILFAGTPEIAVPLLQNLSENFEVRAVLTSPDRASGRSKQLLPSPVKAKALELDIPVLQFESLKTDARDAVRRTGADTLVSFAFGKIFGPRFLALFDNAFNVHPSALPLLRGPAPIQWEIMNKMREASVSLQSISEKMDEGDIWKVDTFALDGTENTLTLTRSVALRAACFVPQALKDIESGKLHSFVQSADATYCSMIDASMAKADFSQPAPDVHALVRAMYPWPKAWVQIEGKKLFLTSVYGGFSELEEAQEIPDCPEGTVFAFDKKKGLGVKCRNSVLWINGLQLPAKKEMDHIAFVNGNRWIIGARFDV